MATAPFNIDTATPADGDFIRLFPNAERIFRDVVESWISVHADATSGYGKIPIDTTANLAALNPQPGVGGMRYDTTVNSLQVKTGASTWVNVGPPAGTVAVFFQENAPTGWTKLTDLGGDFDGAIIELVTGSTGGDLVAGTAVGSILTSRTIAQANLPNVNFTVTGTAASDGAHTHTTDTQGSHTHTGNADNNGDHVHGPGAGSSFVVEGGTGAAAGGGTDREFASTTAGAGTHTHSLTIDSAGSHSHTAQSSGAHTHSVTGNAASGGSGTAMDFAAKRVRAILCVKN